MGVKVLRCKLFNDTAQKYLLPGTPLRKSYENFIASKSSDPTAPYGSSDKPNPQGTPMAARIPKIRHAHLSSNISIFYTISGSNPTELKLYAVMSHDEAGTGQPANPKKQKGIANTMSNQSFY